MTDRSSKPQHFRLACFWAGLGAVGALAVVPYSLAIAPAAAPLPVPPAILALVAAIQTGLLLLLLNWIGLRLGYPIGLDTPFSRAWVRGQPLPKPSRPALIQALAIGGLGGLILVGIDLAFQPWLPPTLTPLPAIALWKRLLAAFYGGITEELLLRLFCMTLLSWVFWKLFTRQQAQPPRWIFWSAIAIAALLFGVGHLPAAAALWPLTPIVILRILTLNSLLGIPFGWLYWQWGLEYAMLAHFCADLVLQGLSSSIGTQ